MIILMTSWGQLGDIIFVIFPFLFIQVVAIMRDKFVTELLPDIFQRVSHESFV